MSSWGWASPAMILWVALSPGLLLIIAVHWVGSLDTVWSSAFWRISSVSPASQRRVFWNESLRSVGEVGCCPLWSLCLKWDWVGRLWYWRWSQRCWADGRLREYCQPCWQLMFVVFWIFRRFPFFSSCSRPDPAVARLSRARRSAKARVYR